MVRGNFKAVSEQILMVKMELFVESGFSTVSEQFLNSY